MMDIIYVFLEILPWIFLSLLLGLLLGWWLWARYRSRWEAAHKDQEELRRNLQRSNDERGKFEKVAAAAESKVKKADSTARTAQNRIKTLEVDFQGERDGFDGQRGELNAEILRLKNERVDFESKIGLLKNAEKTKDNFEAKLKDSEDKAKKLADMRVDLEAKVRVLEANKAEHDDQLDALRNSKRELEGKVSEFEPKLGLLSQFESDKGGMETELGDLRGRISGLESEKRDQDNQVAQLQGENNGLKARLEDAEKNQGDPAKVGQLEGELGNLKGRIGDLEGENNGLKGKVGDLEGKLGRIGELEGENGDLKGKLGDLEGKLGRIGELEGENGDLKGRLAELENSAGRVGDLEGDIATKSKDNDILRETIADLERRLGESEGKAAEAGRVGDLEGRIGELEGENGNLKGRIGELENERGGLQGRIDELEPKLGLLSGLESDKSNLEGENGNLKGRIGELEGQLGRIGELEGENGNLKGRVGELEGQLGRIGELEGENGGLKGRIGELEGQVGRVGELEGENGGLKGRIGELEGQLGRIGELEGENGGLKSRLAELEANAADKSELDALEAKNAKLQDKLREALSRPEPEGPPHKAPSNIDATKVMADEFGGEDVRADKDLGIVYNSKGEADDLQRIKGIGPKLNESLNNHGVYRYKQIANWSDHNVTEFADRLNSFPDRIERDRWIPQAREMADLDPDNPALGEPHKAPDTVDYDKAIADEFQGESVHKDDDLGILYKEKGQEDDLKRIKGVGPVMERELHGHGVYRFKQMANWSNHNVSEFSDRLNTFPDRIERDRWVPQARYLAGLDAEQDNANQAVIAADFAGESVTSDAELGVLYTSRPSTVDDLKRVKGIGPVIEGKLHEFGVYRFKQIANWNDRIVVEFAERLQTFKDRIQRDDWIVQAKAFAKEG